MTTEIITGWGKAPRRKPQTRKEALADLDAAIEDAGWSGNTCRASDCALAIVVAIGELALFDPAYQHEGEQK